VVIAGGGLAAQRCCETLRSSGYEGPIRIACEEPMRPYDRPPLSKDFLLGRTSESSLFFRSAQWYRDMEVDLLLGKRAAGLDPARRELRMVTGEGLRYERLLIATGSAPRRLPAAEGFDNVHYLRDAGEARALRNRIEAGAPLAVIGAGFIGQEVAASARQAGAKVTMIEALPAPLAKVLGSDLGRWFADLHRHQGVEVLLDTTVERFVGNGTVKELVVTGGGRLPCDAVVIGIGVAPALGWIQGSGLPVDGIPVDVGGRSGVPGVYAAGDAALPFCPQLGVHVRSEHWEAAARQGAAAAKTMLGLPCASSSPTSFWSDQYGVRIQFLGHTESADRVEVEGDMEARDFVTVWSQGSRPVAALLVGRPRALAEVRRRLTVAPHAAAVGTELEAA
jgi:NADPH-dependent 2,4-dienoyl-CoA reductase/sulfur reductase-like enzyme